MRNTALLLVCFFLILLSSFGCTRMVIDGSSISQDVYFGSGNQESGEYTRVGDFSTSTKGSWAFFGLSPIKQPDIGKVIKREISSKNGDAVINLEIKTQQTFVDGLIGAVTLGLYTLRSVKISGTVIKFTSSSSLLPSVSSFALEKYASNDMVTYSLPDIITPETRINGLPF